MKSIYKSVVVAVCLLLGVSLTACAGETHGKESSSDAVPVVVGRVQKVLEKETISVSGTVSTPNSPANVDVLGQLQNLDIQQAQRPLGLFSCRPQLLRRNRIETLLLVNQALPGKGESLFEPCQGLFPGFFADDRSW